MAQDDARGVFAERDRDLAGLYPTADAWESSFPPVRRPDEPELRQQFDDLAQLSAVDKALKQGEASSAINAEQQANRQRDLNTHDRMARGAAEASRDVLHDCGPGKEPGAYTVHEARDRAAHTPAVHTIAPQR
jgi:hypothetical protein